jgi:YD repeat-containing protein
MLLLFSRYTSLPKLSEYIRYFGDSKPNNVTITWPPINPIQPLTTPKKVVEEYEYDKQGRIIKKIITESTT